MNNIDYFNGIDAVIHATHAYETLRKSAIIPDNLVQAYRMIVETIVTENPALIQLAGTSESESGQEATVNTIGIGECTCSFSKSSAEVQETVSDMLNSESLRSEGILSFPFTLDKDAPFAITIESQTSNEKAITDLVEYILVSLLSKDVRMRFRCIDGLESGNNFGAAHILVRKCPELSGGKVYTDSKEISEQIKLLNTTSTENITVIGTKGTFKEYNDSTFKKLDSCLTILFAEKFNFSDDMAKLRQIVKNREKNGMSFIIVGTDAFLGNFREYSDYDIRFTDGEFFLDEDEYVTLKPNKLTAAENDENAALLDDLIRKIDAANKIDTAFSHHPELVNSELLTMTSEKKLRIPFAIDRYGESKYLELGGIAPAHGILSGGTGCGKTTTLNAMIMQTVRNYHPDDVELWIIDCKGNEFNKYIDNHTPHFGMIICGNEPEMLLDTIDLIWKEYLRRVKVFGSVFAKDIEEYRKIKGSVRAMPRIFVVIDEFHLLTTAAFGSYSSDGVSYSERLTQIMKLARAMGIILFLSSQNVTVGLKGFSDDALSQASARIAMQNSNLSEVKYVLGLNGIDEAGTANMVASFGKGHFLYKDYSSISKGYSLWIEDLKSEIAKVNEAIGDDYTPKKTIFAFRNTAEGESKREPISKMQRHPIQRFVTDGYEPADEDVPEWYPAAPINLDDYFKIELNDSPGENMLIVGSNEILTSSLVVFSVLSFLMERSTKVVANFINVEHKDRTALCKKLQKIRSDRLIINTELSEIVDTIASFKKLRLPDEGSIIYLWFGLNKLENEMLNAQENLEESETDEEKSDNLDITDEESQDADMLYNKLMNISFSSQKAEPVSPKGCSITYQKAVELLQTVFERGPDNKTYNLALFKAYKEVMKPQIVKIAEFEKRIGCKMSSDDSSYLFGSGLAVNRADEDTVIYYGGSGSVVPIRPFIEPNDEWIEKFNEALRKE